MSERRPTDYDCRCFFLHRPRLELYRRIDARVEEIVAGGLLQARQPLGVCVFLVVPPTSTYRRAVSVARPCLVSAACNAPILPAPPPPLPPQECQMLLDGGILPNSNCGSRAIGYRQGLEFLQRCRADPGSLDEQAVVSAGGEVGLLSPEVQP